MIGAWADVTRKDEVERNATSSYSQKTERILTEDKLQFLSYPFIFERFEYNLNHLAFSKNALIIKIKNISITIFIYYHI